MEPIDVTVASGARIDERRSRPACEWVEARGVGLLVDPVRSPEME